MSIEFPATLHASQSVDGNVEDCDAPRSSIPANAGSNPRKCESADHVLPDLKEPDMYATVALLQFDGSAEVEYASAGHVPILHYRDLSRDNRCRLRMATFSSAV
jgi:hypothetical protein